MGQKQKPGPKPKSLKLGGNWEDAIKKALTAPPLTPEARPPKRPGKKPEPKG